MDILESKKYITNLIVNHITFIKFLLVGVLNTVFGYSVFAFFIWVGLHYPIASFLSTVIGIIFNFFTTGRLVFKNSSNILIFKFLLAYGLTWVCNVSFIWFITLLGYKNMYVIGFVLLLPCAMISYVLMKYFVFKKSKSHSHSHSNS